MKPEELNRRDAFFDHSDEGISLIAKHDDHVAARKSIGKGTRAVNRLLLSLWVLLLPLVWPGSDWIGLIILSQALLVAANLIRPNTTNSSAAALPDGAVLKLNHGEESAEG